MLRRRQINARPSGRGARFPRGLAGRARRRLERLAWPVERLAWTIERRALWPLRERTAGWGPSARVAGAGALAAVAIAAVAAGALLSEGNGAESVERTGTRVGVVTGHVAATDRQASKGPTLQGVPPTFAVGKGVGVAKDSADGSGEAAGGGAATAEASGEAEATDAAGGEAGAEATSAEGAAATASSTKPVPAGPQAMKVARRFAGAFVFYEVGKRPARAKAVFGETATEQLAEALAERPPRLPQGTEVPKAKVVNLVPGPRHGRDYTVSVSLLRVGLTSELRITMHPDKTGAWKVSEILG
jgi:hypothetical protein